MKHTNRLLLITLGIFMSCALVAQEDPYQVMAGSSDSVLQTIDEQRALHNNQVNDGMVQALLDSLSPIVDFESIALAVMGNHRTAAAPAQIDKFTGVFADSMVRLYLESFVAFEIEEVMVLDAPADFDPDSGRATVRMEVTNSANTKFEISYSMRTSDSGEWKVRNIIVDGVNLGLTYLNQFSGAMSRYNNDLDQVIDSWAEELQ